MERVIREAERQGWRVEKAGSGHWKCFSPDGRGIVIASDAQQPQRDQEDDRSAASIRLQVGG
jgi:hypothetical protein